MVSPRASPCLRAARARAKNRKGKGVIFIQHHRSRGYMGDDEMIVM